MNEYKSDSVEKRVKYIASIIYLLVFAFVVGGSYINQQTSAQANDSGVVILSEPD